MSNIGNNAVKINQEVVVQHKENSFDDLINMLYNYINKEINEGNMPTITFSFDGHNFPFTLHAELYEEFEKFMLSQKEFYDKMF